MQLLRYVLAAVIVYLIVGLLWFAFLMAISGGWDFSTAEGFQSAAKIVLAWPVWIYIGIRLGFSM